MPKKRPPMTLAQTIKTAREQQGLAIREAADRAQMSEGRWRQIEKGYQSAAAGVRLPVRPGARLLRQIAAVLDLDGDALVDLAAQQPAPAPSGSDALIAAILNDPALLPEAKKHLANQVELLRRLTPNVDDQLEEQIAREQAQVTEAMISDIKSARSGRKRDKQTERRT